MLFSFQPNDPSTFEHELQRVLSFFCFFLIFKLYFSYFDQLLGITVMIELLLGGGANAELNDCGGPKALKGAFPPPKKKKNVYKRRLFA